MVKSNVCPQCLGELDGYYAEEGHVIVSSEPLNCPRCGFTLLGTVDESENRLMACVAGGGLG